MTVLLIEVHYLKTSLRPYHSAFSPKFEYLGTIVPVLSFIPRFISDTVAPCPAVSTWDQTTQPFIFSSGPCSNQDKTIEKTFVLFKTWWRRSLPNVLKFFISPLVQLDLWLLSHLSCHFVNGSSSTCYQTTQLLIAAILFATKSIGNTPEITVATSAHIALQANVIRIRNFISW